MAPELFLKATACLSSLLSLPGPAQTLLGSRTVAGGFAGGGNLKASKKRPGWELPTVEDPAGTEARVCIQGIQGGLSSNLKFVPPQKKNTLVGWLPSPSYTHTPWQWPSGSSGMSSDASPFLSGLRGLSCPDLGIWGQWSLKFPQPLIPCKLQVLQHQRSERQSGLGMTPRPAEN